MTQPNIIDLCGKRVLVTGGAGFIGSHLCQALVELGAHVTSVDDLSAGKLHNYHSFQGKSNFRAVQADVTDKTALLPLFAEGFDVVFHNAASKKTVCLIDPGRDLAVNGGGTLNLLQLSLAHQVGKFVHASTGSVYGEPVILPTDENHPLNPNSYYGVSKLAGERYVHVFHQLHGMNTTILRYFHVYGPRQESNEFGGVVSIFLRNVLEQKPLTIHGDGSQLRSFTWVLDLVRANLLAAVNPRAKGEVYNCASGVQVSVGDLAHGISELAAGTGTRPAIGYGDWVLGDIKHFEVCNQKIQEHLGMSFETNFWGRMQETYGEFVSYLKSFEVAGHSLQA